MTFLASDTHLHSNSEHAEIISRGRDHVITHGSLEITCGL